MKKLVLILFFIVNSAALIAQEKQSLTQILAQIAIHHPALQPFDFEVQAMDEAVKGAKSWMPPQVAVGTFMTPYQTTLWQNNGMNGGMGSLMFSVQQMIPKSGLLKAQAHYMQSKSTVVRTQKNVVLNEVLNNAKVLYYNWLIYEKKKSVLKTNREILNQMLQIATLRYGENAEKITAYYQIKAALANVFNEELMLENGIKTAKNQLNTMMDKPANSLLTIDTNLNFKSLPIQILDSATLFRNKSEFLVMDAQMASNVLQQKVEKQSLKPEFGVSFGHMQTFGNQPLLFSAMLMVNIPSVAWANKMNKANIQKLNFENKAIEAQKSALFNAYAGELYGVHNEMELKIQQISNYEKAWLPSLKKGLETVQLAYAQNTENLSTVYEMWEKLNDAQLMYFQLIKEALDAQVAYEKIMEVK